MNKFSYLLRSTAFRLSSLYILLFCIIAVGLSIYMTNLSVAMLTRQTEVTLEAELNNIQNNYLKGGIVALVHTIDRRARQPGAYLYLVADKEGDILAGNVASIEPGLLLTQTSAKQTVTYLRYGETGSEQVHRAIASVINLPNGMKLLVGRDLSELQHYVRVTKDAFILALLFMSIGAFLIWFFIGRRALLRIDHVTKASQRLMDGDLSGRLPVTGVGDEFDRLSNNLNVMLDRIEALTKGLGHVSDNIAHDLKTPLTRLRNNAEGALTGDKTPQDYRHALEAIITESDQLIRTFNAILMISRIEISHSIENLTPTNIKTIVSDVVELYEPVAEERAVLLKLGDTFDETLLLNRELIAQSLFNLIDNAIKYASIGNANPIVDVYMHKQDDRVEIVVADNGSGIQPEERERAVERFVRLEESRTQPGFGIGLSLARAIMLAHGGQLKLEDNKPGLKALLIFSENKK